MSNCGDKHTMPSAEEWMRARAIPIPAALVPSAPRR
jgi:hypothetical protein